MKLRPIITIIILLFAPGMLFASEAENILRKAQTAEKNVSYKGIKVAKVHFGKKVTASKLKVIHQKPDKTRTEYFSPETVAGTVVIRDGCDYWRYHPAGKIWEPLNIKKIQPADGVCDSAFKNYDVEIIGKGEAANRPAYIIRAIPKYRGEPAHRLWIDCEHYIVLGTQAISPSGVVVSSSHFSSVEINPAKIDDGLFRVPEVSKHRKTPGNQPDFKALEPSYLPKGYKLTGISQLTLNGMVCSHLQFSNGANIISLFQRRASDSIKPPCVNGKVLHVYTWSSGGMLFTLVGNISSAELQKIAKSVR